MSVHSRRGSLTDCHTAYRAASDRTKQRFNTAVFERLEVRDGCITDQECNAPFDLLFRASEFQLEHLVGQMHAYWNSVEVRRRVDTLGRALRKVPN